MNFFGKSEENDEEEEILSSNFYGELFFDYLEISYENTLIHLINLIKRFTRMKFQLKLQKALPD